MPKEIKVYSMSVLDLLTCALGSTVLISFLLIVSIIKPASSGFPYAYFTASAEVWVDVHELAKLEAPKEVSEMGTDNSGKLVMLESLPKEYEVELQVYRKDEGSSDFSVNPDEKPRFCVNSAHSGIVRNMEWQETGKFFARADKLGLRPIKIEGQHRVYTVYRLSASGFAIKRGWYFIGLCFVKTRGRVPGEMTAAWLRIESGGKPGVAIYQTHPTFPDRSWPFSKGAISITEQYPALQNYRAGKKSPEKQMQLLRLPDAYLSEWPEQYPDRDAPPVKYELEYGLRSSNTDWPFYFSLRHKRWSSLPPAARFPVLKTNATVEEVKKSPGWHRDESKDIPVWDHYLPGFRIGEEKTK